MVFETEVLDSSRPDLPVALVVDRGVEVCELQGKTAAAKYRTEQRVPFNILVRVLAEPSLRRKKQRAFGPQSANWGGLK